MNIYFIIIKRTWEVCFLSTLPTFSIESKFITFVSYEMLIPALATPVMAVARSSPAVTAAENTNSNRVPAVTGIFRPVVIPLLVAPIATIPVRGGANVTLAPAIGENTLSGVVDSYNCAVIDTVEPTNVNANVVLK